MAPSRASRGVDLRYSVESVKTTEGLASIEPDWNRLSKSSVSPNVFATFDWFWAWYRYLIRVAPNGRRNLNVVVLRQDGVVAGISPLVERTASRFGVSIRKVEFLAEHADYNDLVVGNDPAGQSRALADFLAQTQGQWDLVDLRDLRATGNTRTLIESAVAPTGLHYRFFPEKNRCPYLPIESGSGIALQRQSRHVRRTLQKRMERARSLGLRTRIIENPHEELKLLDKLITVENQKLLLGKLAQPFIGRYPEVFQALFDTLGPRGWIYIALMEQGDRPVAWQIGFRCGKALWDYNKAYDHAFARLAPGTMLVPAVLDYGFSQGFDEYDFLRGEEPYKMIWSSDCHERLRLVIQSDRWAARARALVYIDIKERVYRLFGKGE